MSVLVANRSEVAIRIARSCELLGVDVYGVFTEDDAASLHVKRLPSHLLPGQGVRGYCDQEAIIALASKLGVSFIHPGYGFLRFEDLSLRHADLAYSENADFAALARKRGIGFVGPSVEVLELFGDKLRSRAFALAVGVPVVEGTLSPMTLAEMERFYQSLPEGSCIMIKSEATAAFGRGDVYAERLILRGRHIEVQIIGDKAGNVVALGERECSLQRRHQKILEVAPSPSLNSDVRKKILNAAVSIAKGSTYCGIGTVEFLLEPSSGRFYFIEVNPRLQVEHTVTEEVYGVDLIAIQLELAKGALLSDLGLATTLPQTIGYAIQCRVNAEKITEDASAIPSSGSVKVFEPCTGSNVRVESALYAGYKCSPNYDSMLAKVIVRSRSPVFGSAIRVMKRCLAEFRVEGIETNIGLLRNILDQPEIIDGFHVHTDYVLENIQKLIAPRKDIQRFFQSSFTNNNSTGTLPPLKETYPSGVEPLISPLTGTVISLAVTERSHVKKGAEIAVLLAMKMEHVIYAPFDGKVSKLLIANESIVEANSVILLLERTTQTPMPESLITEITEPSGLRNDLLELRDRQQRLTDEHRPAAVKRRHRKGLRTARENIADLVEEGSFVEYGALAVAAQRSRRKLDDLINTTPADGLVCGIGSIACRDNGESTVECGIFAYDFTVLAGTQGYWNHKKMDRLLHVVHRLKIPVIGFFEGGGGRPGDSDSFLVSVAGLELDTFRLLASLSGVVPLVGIAAGKLFAGNAALLGCCDVIIATRNSNIGMAGPAMIEGGGLGVFKAEEIGPVSVQLGNGVIDLLVEDEAEAVRTAKVYISFFQGKFDSFSFSDQSTMRIAVPSNRRRVYDIRQVIKTISDISSNLELTKHYGSGMITTLARIGGMPVGIFANDPKVGSGAIDTPGALKLARFLRLCDSFNIPLVSLCDTPGFLVGPKAEETGQVKAFGDLFIQFAKIRVPVLTVVLRRGTGLGAMAMAGGSFHASNFTISWPTGEFSGMGIDGAVRLAFKKEIEAIQDPAARQRFFEDKVSELHEHGKAINMASFLEIDAVIDPTETRSWLIKGLSVSNQRPKL
ncbi:hypothetical protein HDU67_001163 [Dinochytrium kinnereticum]|nr:hypothetical protein HDU67_001163 [Dinochytrium kinnereticum]